ncbi:hypothetical protein AAFP30_05360 [Gordonia sp. CPCC 205515]|uniref:TY-Chap domain-containing protein n=1 Tax=Gordonia sp. CPCC 205515 TaxID=3140791 RepID=UPI003AF371E7
MTDMSFDALVESAWSAFTGDLVMQLNALDVGDGFDVRQSPEFPGPHGCIRFSVTRARRWRATIDAADLHTSPDCHEEQADWLVHTGWRRLRNHTFIREVAASRCNELADAAVHALRGVWDPVDPAFLAHATDEMPIEPVIEIDPPSPGPDRPTNT